VNANYNYYIGDGVYLRFEKDVYCLYTSDGTAESNRIFLDVAEMNRLIETVETVDDQR
jgi:hypothetical protein